MLYPTTNQPLMLALLVVIGIASGVLFDIFSAITSILGNDRATKHFFDFFAVILTFALLFVANIHFNYGQFRIYLLPVFFGGFLLEKTISKFLWTKAIKKCYIKVRKRGKK